MAFLDYIPILRGALLLASKIMKKVNEKKKDDGKIDQEEALEIISDVIPELADLIKSFVR